MKTFFVMGLLMGCLLGTAPVLQAQASEESKVWVQVFNTFDPVKNNVVIVLQSGEWVQRISYLRKLELAGPVLRFTYGEDSRREFRGIVQASAVKMIYEAPLR